MTFIKKPKIPFSLIVTISTKETVNAMKNEVRGPKINPPIAIIIDYFLSMSTEMKDKIYGFCQY